MFLEKLLSAIEPTSKSIISSIKKNALKNDSPLSKRDIEFIKFDIKRDLIKCVYNYVKQSDVLKKVESFSRQGKIVAVIHGTRENEPFIIYTDVILCGGYNIQRLHTRYTVQTNLPKIETDKTFLKELSNEGKALKKKYDNIDLLESYKNRMKSHRERLRTLKGMSFDEVVEQSGLKAIYRRPFSDLSKDDLEIISKNNETCLRTKEKYDKHVENKIGKSIKDSHKKTIESCKRDIERFKELITKLKNKI